MNPGSHSRLFGSWSGKGWIFVENRIFLGGLVNTKGLGILHCESGGGGVFRGKFLD